MGRDALDGCYAFRVDPLTFALAKRRDQALWNRHPFEVLLLERDGDGDAVAGDAFWAQIAYSYLQEKYALVVTVEAGESEYDKRNPVYGLYQDLEWVSLGAPFFWHLRPNLSLVR